MKRGFTLIELVMVIAVIALLAAIIIPRFTVQIVEARISTTRANLQTLRSALQLYYANEGVWPTAGLNELITESPITYTIYLRAIPPETLGGTNNATVRASLVATAGGWWYDEANHEIYVSRNSVPNSNRLNDAGDDLNPSTDW